jgi:D-glycero-D-manno-heptose 1,7-bisphosphate phosphatase
MKRAVFLDRDGVLNASQLRNGKPYAPTCVDDFHLMPQARHHLTRLNRAGFLLVVVTNQPDIGAGRVEAATVDAMNRRLAAELPVDDILVCPHTPQDGCDCRKPKPGMLLRAAQRHDCDLAASYMIGDRFGDIAAGNAAGCTSVLIGDGYGEAEQASPAARAADLAAAVDFVLRDAAA